MTLPKLIKSIFFISILMFTKLNLFSQETVLFPSEINIPQNSVTAPFISFDGNSAVFIIETELKDFVAESKKDINGNWTKPVYIDAINNMETQNFYIESPSYNQNASEIYFAKRSDNKDSVSNIWVTKKINGIWSKPQKLPSPVNSNQNESDPCISPDGQTLYFVRDIENEAIKKYSCKTIMVSSLKNNVWTNPIELPEPVNSGCDRCPRISADGKTLYFSSIRNLENKNADIYYSKRITKNAWITPIPINNVNTPADELFPSIDADNKNFIFTRNIEENKKEISRIFVSDIPPEFKPEKTLLMYGIISDLNSNLPISAKIDVFDPYSSILLFSLFNNSQTGEYSFVLEKDRSYKIDIYNENYSHNFIYTSTQNITEPKIIKDIKLYNNVNLILNVFDNETYEPLEGQILVTDTETSQKIEILSQNTDKGRYLLKLEIGKNYKIEVSKKHYVTSSTQLNLTETVQFSEFEKDIQLQINKIDYEIALSDSETGKGVETTVEITNLTTNEKTIVKAQTDKDGKLKIKLRDGNRYEISVTPNGYAFANATVDLIDEQPEKKSEIKLNPLKKETKIELNDINFEFNSADLNQSSFEELDRVVKLMQNNPEVKIEISAHTDDVGSDAYNLKLSEKRAASVVQYLIDKNISPENLTAKGYGKRKPAYFPVNTDENRAKNRRVEMKIIEIL